MMRFFYVPEIQQSEVCLSEDESKHCIRVLRLVKGEQVKLVDGKGNLYTCVIKEPDLRKCRLEIMHVEKDYGKRDHYLHVAISPTKSADRFEWFLEKSVEIGVDEITPIMCGRSERNKIRYDRAEKIMVSAIKQSGRAYLPRLNPIIRLESIILNSRNPNKVICHCESNSLPIFADLIRGRSNALIMVGPEGDFTRDEIGLARKNDFSEARLGPFTYRTETAGIIVCSIFNFIHGQ
jgi:16S rRNA (uracil1498-N3)-methyltransferase